MALKGIFSISLNIIALNMIKLIKFCLYVRPSIKTFFDEEEGVIYPTYKNDASLFKNMC